MQLEISDSITNSLRLPPSEAEPRLRTELAIALYAQGILSFGKASELAELSRYQFADLVTSREIPRHYTELELALDLAYTRGRPGKIATSRGPGKLSLLRHHHSQNLIDPGRVSGPKLSDPVKNVGIQTHGYQLLRLPFELSELLIG